MTPGVVLVATDARNARDITRFNFTNSPGRYGWMDIMRPKLTWMIILLQEIMKAINGSGPTY